MRASRYAPPGAWERFWRLLCQQFRLASTVFLCALAVLTGCRVGPHQAPPSAPPIPLQYASADSDTEDLSWWWSQFHDPILDQLVAEAWYNNLPAREAYYRLRQARATLDATRGTWFPEVFGDASYRYSKNSGNISRAPLANFTSQPLDLFSTGFDAAWEIDMWGRIARSIEAARQDMIAACWSWQDARATLVAEVAATYIQVRVLQNQLEVAKRNAALQEATLQTVKSRVDAGLTGELDAAQAEANVRFTQSAIPVLTERLQASLFALDVLLGNAADGQRQLVESYAVVPSPPSPRPGIPAELLSRRPDVRQAEASVRAASERIGVARAARLPELTLRGTISVDANSVASLFTTQSLAHAVGPAVRWNLLNFGRLRNQVEIRRAQYQIALTRYQHIVLEAVAEVQSGLVSSTQQVERIGILESAARASTLAVELSEARYAQDLVTFQRVLDAQRQLVQAESLLAEARGAACLAAIGTYKALGGGWQQAPLAEEVVSP